MELNPFNLHPIQMFFWLVIGHFLADYPLQGDFLSQAKNPNTELGQKFGWRQALAAHSFIHAGFVALITGSVVLALWEALCHSMIDLRKCHGRITLNQDQTYHIACKVWWTAIIYFVSLI